MEKKLDSASIQVKENTHEGIVVVEFTAAEHASELVYAITCDCVCVG